MVYWAYCILRFLKKLLQFIENFNSQSSPTRNRWEEADRLCMTLAALTEQLPVTADVASIAMP